jgi:hypothetical protein
MDQARGIASNVRDMDIDLSQKTLRRAKKVRCKPWRDGKNHPVIEKIC